MLSVEETLLNKAYGCPGGDARLMRDRDREIYTERERERDKSLSMNNFYHYMGLKYIFVGHLLDSRNCAKHGALFVSKRDGCFVTVPSMDIKSLRFMIIDLGSLFITTLTMKYILDLF